MGTMADEQITPLLNVRVDMNQARLTTITMRYTSSTCPDAEGNPCIHTHLSTSLDAKQVRALIEHLEKGIGGTWGK